VNEKNPITMERFETDPNIVSALTDDEPKWV